VQALLSCLEEPKAPSKKRGKWSEPLLSRLLLRKHVSIVFLLVIASYISFEKLSKWPSGGQKRLWTSKPYGFPIFLEDQESIHRHQNKLLLPHFANCCIACWLNIFWSPSWLLCDILIFKQIANLKMVPLIHFFTQNDCVHDKNVIISITDFLFQIFIIMVIADLFFKIFLLMVITDHWTSCIFCVVISPHCKNQFYN
jgi:hypothetical protein